MCCKVIILINFPRKRPARYNARFCQVQLGVTCKPPKFLYLFTFRKKKECKFQNQTLWALPLHHDCCKIKDIFCQCG